MAQAPVVITATVSVDMQGGVEMICNMPLCDYSVDATSDTKTDLGDFVRDHMQWQHQPAPAK